jgi:tight adherence protein C
VEVLAGAFFGASVLSLASARRARMRPGWDRLLVERAEPYLARAHVRMVFAAVGRGRIGSRARADLRLRRRHREADARWSLEAMAGLKVLLPLGLGLLVLGGAFAAPSAALLLPPIAALGYGAPDFLLARRVHRRRRVIDAGVPELVEVLAALTGGGAPPALALSRAVRSVSGPLGAELALAMRRVELGAPWRSAVGQLTQRTASRDLRRLARALELSQRLGSSLAQALHELAADLRAERRARAEEAARRAPVKMLFPLVLLVLPAFILLTVGPVLLATLRSLR